MREPDSAALYSDGRQRASRRPPHSVRLAPLMMARRPSSLASRTGRGARRAQLRPNGARHYALTRSFLSFHSKRALRTATCLSSHSLLTRPGTPSTTFPVRISTRSHRHGIAETHASLRDSISITYVTVFATNIEKPIERYRGRLFIIERNETPAI